MSKLHELYAKLENKKISLLASRPGMKKLELLIDMILYYGLEKGDSVTIYTSEDKYWLHNHILAHLNETNIFSMEKYLYPCMYNFGEYHINEDKILENIETLRQSKIRIESLERVADYTDYTLEKEATPSDIVIIYDIESFFKNGYRSPKEVMDDIATLKKDSQIILVAGVNRTVEETENYSSFEEIHYYRELEHYIDETILLHRKTLDSRGAEITLVVDTKESSFEITYNTETDRFD